MLENATTLAVVAKRHNETTASKDVAFIERTAFCVYRELQPQSVGPPPRGAEPLKPKKRLTSVHSAQGNALGIEAITKRRLAGPKAQQFSAKFAERLARWADPLHCCHRPQGVALGWVN